MVELSREKSYMSLPLLVGLEHIGSLYSVIEGKIDGTIHADNDSNPCSVFITTPDGFILAGRPDDNSFNHDISSYFRTVITPRAMKAAVHSYEFFCLSDWEKPLCEVILKDYLPMKHSIHYYLLQTEHIDIPKYTVPENMKLERIDDRFLLRSGLGNFNEVSSRIAEWGSNEGFIVNGFGFCLVEGNTIVSRCISDCVYGDYCEVGVGTDPAYRRKGYASIVVSAAIRYCIEHKITRIGWHASDTNPASQKTAERAGFRLVYDYPGYYGCYKERDHYLEYGFYLLIRQKEPAGALEYFKKAFDMGIMDVAAIHRIEECFTKRNLHRYAADWLNHCKFHTSV